MFPYNMDDVLIVLTGDIAPDLQRGYEALTEDMKHFPSFDAEAEYSEKNNYFLRAQRIGHLFFRPGSYWAAEIYYSKMLGEILSFEEQSSKHFNKGMVYSNLGIAEIALGKFEIGIPHLLMAEREDNPIDPNFRILNSPLWHQFEKPHIFKYLMSLNTKVATFVIDDPFLTATVTSMEPQDRIFFEGTLFSILYNYSIMGSIRNSYSLGQLYSGLKDICLLTESLLRKHQYPGGTGNNGVLLPPLLENAVGNQLFDAQVVRNKK